MGQVLKTGLIEYLTSKSGAGATSIFFFNLFLPIQLKFALTHNYLLNSIFVFEKY